MTKKYFLLFSFCFGWLVSSAFSFSAAAASQSHLVSSEDIRQQLINGKLVGFGDVHGSELVVKQLMQFLQVEDNWQQVDDIVVEFGNSRYQTLADNFVVQGADIPMADVRHIWRDTLYFMAWQYQIYEDFVVQLRRWNQQRQHKVRLLLAEPTLEWRSMTHNKWLEHEAQRELGYLHRIEAEVINKHRHGLLLFGTYHLIKQPVLMGNGKHFSSVASLLSAKHPNIIYTIWPRMRGDNVSAQYPAPYLVSLAGSELGARNLSSVTGPRLAKNQLLFSEAADAYLYLSDTERHGQVSKAAASDTQWQLEMKRRAALLGGRIAKQIDHWLKHHATKIVSTSSE